MSPIKQGVSLVSFVRRSTQVKIALQPFYTGKLVIKSIDIISQGLVAFGRGNSEPEGLVVLAFIRWQVEHVLQ